jgi:hypothetical protein
VHAQQQLRQLLQPHAAAAEMAAAAIPAKLLLPQLLPPLLPLQLLLPRVACHNQAVGALESLAVLLLLLLAVVAEDTAAVE